MSTFNSEKLIEALKRKRFATGKLAETLEIPVDVLHKIIATSEGDDLIVAKLNALLDEAEPEETLETAALPVTEEILEILVAERWTSFESDFKDRLYEMITDTYQKLLIDAFLILTPIQRLKQAVEEGKLSKDQILTAENKSPVPRTTVIEWTQTISKTED